jgi:hypothetical protein
LKQSAYSTRDEFEDAIMRTIEDIPKETLFGIWANSRGRFEARTERDGDYLSKHFLNIQKDEQFNKRKWVRPGTYLTPCISIRMIDDGSSDQQI